MVVFFEQSIVFNCPLLELHIYTAAVDADDASDATARGEEKEKLLGTIPKLQQLLSESGGFYKQPIVITC